MTDTPTADAETDQVAESEIDIERDHSFVHFAADSAVVIDLGRDIEIAFLRLGPQPFKQRKVGEGEDERIQFKFRSTATEVSRVRLAPFSAIQLAMLTIQKLVESGQVDVEALSAAITNITKLAPTDETDVTH